MSPFVKLCEQITASKNTIEELKKEMERLKGLQRCPSCGASVSIEAAFCPSCGTKMPEVKVEEVVQEAKEAAEDIAEKAGETVEQVKEKVEDIVEDVKEKLNSEE